MGDWHAMSVKEVLNELSSGPEGLGAAQARQRLAQYGKNELDKPKADGLFLRLLRQLRDPMILVLLAAAGLSLLASGGADWIDAVIILVIVAVNGIISICQEDNARRALDALEKMAPPKARVVRDGQLQQTDAALLVPGDVILLEAGDRIPADGRLLECVGLQVDESAMTGESVPVRKTPTDRLDRNAPMGDRNNMVLGATTVTAGRGRAVVVATGMNTQMGHIAGLLLVGEPEPTPLQRKMEEISKVLSALCLGVCAITFGVGLLQGKAISDMFLTAVSLAVAAIPEGLPAIVSIVLALGVGRMARSGAIIKRLPAVETLGCAGVICSDKTGTLTQNRMTVTEIWTVGGDENPALMAGVLCNDARLTDTQTPRAQGDPTEAALVEAAARAGLLQEDLERQLPRVGEVPFDSARKRMTTVHKRKSGGWRIVVKGAPDVLLTRCDRVWTDRVTALDDRLRDKIVAANGAMAGRALRVLAVAFRDVDCLPPMTAPALERELVFAGLLGMTDPPRPEVAAAVAQCIRAGVRPVMITGDHKATAVAVARQLGIFRPGETALTGADLDFMPQQLLEQEIEHISVFARVTPEHKMRIVRAWKKRDQIVAMTGDGVNDAPALKEADIGCAMGIAGTDVAKGAAEMVLTDDNFAAIVRAVEEGRGIYANIRKAIHYLLSCNVGEIVTVFAAAALGFSQMPLLPVQLLWLNLVTDSLPALALGVEPVERSVMSRPPRGTKEPLFSRTFMFKLGWQGLLVGGLTLLAYFLGLAVIPGAAGAAATANTMAFATLTLCQLFHAYDVRSEDKSLFSVGVLSNPAMNRAFVIGFAMQLAVLTLPPLQRVFSVVSLGPVQWLAVLGSAVSPVLVCELAKWLGRR
ncbi:MAG: calcium-translocating P-type ATPase, PMCA-type [Oscillospiraceae bacterium]|nr:calcium-translocating P-type ATPase, PMCA-type [Oscillospiraceae bacterium]